MMANKMIIYLILSNRIHDLHVDYSEVMTMNDHKKNHLIVDYADGCSYWTKVENLQVTIKRLKVFHNLYEIWLNTACGERIGASAIATTRRPSTLSFASVSIFYTIVITHRYVPAEFVCAHDAHVEVTATAYTVRYEWFWCRTQYETNNDGLFNGYTPLSNEHSITPNRQQWCTISYCWYAILLGRENKMLMITN